MRLSHKGRDRHLRRVAVRKILKNKADLKVVKVADGYQLASSNGTLVNFGQVHAKEAAAVEYGVRRFGVKAKRILKKGQKPA